LTGLQDNTFDDTFPLCQVNLCEIHFDIFVHQKNQSPMVYNRKNGRKKLCEIAIDVNGLFPWELI
jgi:hypothetical protein